MNSIMVQVKPKHPELSDLEFAKNAESDFVYTLSSTSTKLGHYVYYHKISDEFDYGSNRTKTVLSYLPLN